MKQFGRVIRLKIGNKNESIEIDNLRISFDVEKMIKAEPNNATVSIYNLSESNRNMITSKEYNYVELFVGYVEDTLKMIFCGDIIHVENEQSDLDIITNLKCADGYKAFTEATTIKTMSAGQTDSDFVDEAVKCFDIEKGSIDLPRDRTLPRGKVFMCDTRELMHKVAINNNADWSIQDDQLVIIPKDKTLKGEEGYIISSDTGMISSPKRTDKGMEIVTLCNPHYKIGGLVRVESKFKEYNGDYKIQSIKHSGDILSDDWYSQLLCTGGKFS